MSSRAAAVGRDESYLAKRPVLQEHQAGAELAELLRRHNISRETFYRWQRKFVDMGVSEAQRLKQLEAENARLKRIVADQALNLQVHKYVLGKT